MNLESLVLAALFQKPNLNDLANIYPREILELNKTLELEMDESTRLYYTEERDYILVKLREVQKERGVLE
jgi:hypothetical protein